MAHILKFKGDSYIATPDIHLDHTGDFTIEAWLKSDIPDGPAIPDRDESVFIFKKSDGDSFQYGMELRWEKGGVVLNGYYGENGKISREIPKFVGAWRHLALAVSFSESGDRSSAAIYINGEAGEASSPATTGGKTPCVKGDLYIGKNFRGKIAEVRVWGVERSRDRIKENMHNPLTGREPGLLARLPLNDGGLLLKESVFQRKTTAFHVGWEEEKTPVPAPSDACLNMQWGTHGAKVDGFDGFPSVRITVEFWIKTSHAAARCIPFSYKAGEYAQAFRIENANSLTVVVCGEKADTGVNAADGQWRHVAVSWRALTGRLILYKDGVKRFETGLARGKYIPDSGDVALGRGEALPDGAPAPDPGASFEGKLCDARIWSIIRSPGDIVQDMFYRLAGDEPDLASYWRLDDGAGDTAKNSCPDRPALDSIDAGAWTDSGLFLKHPLGLRIEETPEWMAAMEEIAEPSATGSDRPDDGLARANGIVKRRSMAAAAIGLVPVPMVDLVGLTGIQLGMIRSLAKLYRLPFQKEICKSLLATLVGVGLPLSASPRLACMIKWIPVVGQGVGVLTSSALGGAATYAVGKVFIHHFESGGTFLDFDPEKVKDYYFEQLNKGKTGAIER